MTRVQDSPFLPHLTPQCPSPLDKSTLLTLAGEWRDLIASRGRRPDYVVERYNEVCWVLAATEYSLADSRVQIALGKLRESGMSLRSCEKYLSSIRSFCGWLARPSARVIPFNPLTEIPAFNKKRDRRHERTSFVPVFERLLATVEGSRRVYRGVAGIDRAELYHAAACTGLREGTLRLLEVGQFQLDKVPAFVKARADQLKDGDDLVVPIQADSAARIAKYFAGKMPSTRAFKCPPFDYDFARMLKKDLAEAGIPYCREVELANGRRRREQVLDFHALRHTFGSWCAAANVPLTTTQRWMGHSTPELTANLYTHVIPADQAAAVASMPPLPGVKRAS